jgi:hypothetical protein
MSDPTRTSRQAEQDVEQLLLKAGRAPSPTSTKEHAFLVACGAVAASGLSAEAAAPRAGAPKAGSLPKFGWMGVVGLTTVVGSGAVAWTLRGPVKDAAHVPTASIQASSTSVPTLPAASASAGPEIGTVDTAISGEFALSPTKSFARPSAALPATAPVARRTAPAQSTESPSTAARSSNSSSLSAELVVLDQARRAMSAGEPQHAVAVLDAYQSRFPRGEMATEATVLRVEALVNAGERSAARRVADAFMATDSGSPYASRIRSILSMSNR